MTPERLAAQEKALAAAEAEAQAALVAVPVIDEDVSPVAGRRFTRA